MLVQNNNGSTFLGWFPQAVTLIMQHSEGKPRAEGVAKPDPCWLNLQLFFPYLFSLWNRFPPGMDMIILP